MIAVLLADDQMLIRRGVRSLLQGEAELDVVGEAGSGAEAVELALTLRPDVVVMDLRMPDGDGVWATTRICAEPSLAHTRVLVLTTFELDDYVLAALRAGASGFLGKSADPSRLAEAIRTVHDGGSLLSPTATRQLIEHFLRQPEVMPPVKAIAELTQREVEVVSLAGLGLNNAEIAQRLVISPLTAKTHIAHALAKTGSRDRAQLVVLAYQAGLVRP